MANWHVREMIFRGGREQHSKNDETSSENHYGIVATRSPIRKKTQFPIYRGRKQKNQLQPRLVGRARFPAG